MNQVRARRGIVMLALVGLAVSCSVPAPANTFFPTYPSLNGLPDGAIEGTLVEDGGCLWIEWPHGQRDLGLWPEAARLVEESGALVVRQGEHRAEVGRPMRAGGGEYTHEDHYEFVVELIGEEIPTACQAAHYWLAHDARTIDR